MKHASFFPPTLLVVLCLLCGCSTAVYQPSRVAGFELEAEREIDDEDIQKAFAAKPQVPAQPTVSYFVFDDDYADGVAKMLGKLPTVKSTYRIPSLMVNGKRRFDQDARNPYHSEPSQPLSLKKLRLLAARAQTDILVVVDYGYRVESTPNGLAALGVLIIPTFFAPMRDVRVESYVDSYVIDTRNGYLYGHLQTNLEQSEDYLDVWNDAPKAMIDAQFSELVSKTGRLLDELLVEERASSAKVASGATPEATSARHDSDVAQSR